MKREASRWLLSHKSVHISTCAHNQIFKNQCVLERMIVWLKNPLECFPLKNGTAQYKIQLEVLAFLIVLHQQISLLQFFRTSSFSGKMFLSWIFLFLTDSPKLPTPLTAKIHNLSIPEFKPEYHLDLWLLS